MTTEAHDYAVFGGVLRSRMEIPELPSIASGRADWTFEPGVGDPPILTIEPLGDRVTGAEKYSLWRSDSGFRLEYSHAGTYDISGDGAWITWYPGRDPRPELVRWCLLGSVMALALERTGCLCLHGSAVSFERDGSEVAVAFLAPKHHGKSTLAAALTIEGARLVGDDTLAVTPGPPFLLRPGVPSVRLWEDSVDRLRVGELGSAVVLGIKTSVSGLDPARFQTSPIPLEAVYLLAPFRGDQAVARSLLGAGAGAIRMAQHTKLPDSLIGARAAGAKLKVAADIAATVPVYRLELPRDFGRLPAVVDQLSRWHGNASNLPSD